MTRLLDQAIKSEAVPPMILVFANGGETSFFSDSPDRTVMGETVVIRELIPHIDQHYRTIPSASGRSVHGFSMGGFGALRLAAKYPERFRAAGGHSSITHFDQFKLFVEEPLEAYGCPKEDQSVLERMLQNRQRLPALRFDCGSEDQLIEYNRQLDRELKQAGIPHIYEEFPGGHSWPYWETHLAEMLKFFAQCLKSREAK